MLTICFLQIYPLKIALEWSGVLKYSVGLKSGVLSLSTNKINNKKPKHEYFPHIFLTKVNWC